MTSEKSLRSDKIKQRAIEVLMHNKAMFIILVLVLIASVLSRCV